MTEEGLRAVTREEGGVGAQNRLPECLGRDIDSDGSPSRARPVTDNALAIEHDKPPQQQATEPDSDVRRQYDATRGERSR